MCQRQHVLKMLRKIVKAEKNLARTSVRFSTIQEWQCSHMQKLTTSLLFLLYTWNLAQHSVLSRQKLRTGLHLNSKFLNKYYLQLKFPGAILNCASGNVRATMGSKHDGTSLKLFYQHSSSLEILEG